jgi:dihydrofolate reductase
LETTDAAAARSVTAVCRYYPIGVNTRKVVASLFMTLDGVVEAPEEWHFQFADDEMQALLAERMAEEDVILLGRRTYEEFARAWPGSDSPLADHMNNTPKLVVSESLAGVEWQNSILIDEPIAQQLPRLKRRVGGNIAVAGSVTLVQSLLRHGLIDELRLLVHPVVVGCGTRLAKGTLTQTAFDLVRSEALSSGVLDLMYVPRPRDIATLGSRRSQRLFRVHADGLKAPAPMSLVADGGHSR